MTPMFIPSQIPSPGFFLVVVDVDSVVVVDVVVNGSHVVGSPLIEKEVMNVNS